MSHNLYTTQSWQIAAVIAGLIYILPWLVGVCRHMRRSWLVLLVTLVTGWTLIGWVACMVWACCGRTLVDQAYLRAETGWQSNEHSSLFRPDPNKSDPEP